MIGIFIEEILKKKVVLSMLIVCFIFLLIPSSGVLADEYYNINTYDVHIIVNDDNSYNITETITVDFSTERHGIYREIPTKYNDLYHSVNNIEVINPNTLEKYKTKVDKSSDFVTIRIGDEDEFVSGIVPYQISYTYNSGMDYNLSRDEFYFNVIGTQWNATINEVTFEIEMPKSFNPNHLNFVSGYEGSTDTTYINYVIDGRKILGSTLNPLQPYQGLTVALPLEEGYYDNVATQANMILFYVLLGLMLIITIYSFIKNRMYHKNNTIIPIECYTTPDNLNPAEVAYIYNNESISNNALASLVLRWASLGFLTISEGAKSFAGTVMTYTKIREISSDIPSYERTLFNSMFKLGDGTTVTSSDLQNTFYKDINKASISLRQKFTGEKEILVNKVQGITKLYAFILTILFSLSMGYVGHHILRNGFLANWIPSIILGISFFFMLIIIQIFAKSYKIVSIILTTALIVELTSYSIYMHYTGFITRVLWHPPLVAASIAAFIICYILSMFLILSIREYTIYGKEMVRRIEGFKAFLKEAKMEELKLLYDETPSYFYDILPYTMALGLTSQWEKHVSKLVSEPPRWYYSRTPFRANDFASSMSRSMQTASSQPSSSSSSGGSSGGGSGGGGGGSW